ncbi:unnamed protein product [Mycena citricolor]|uniref:Uncharacterized protein n=1 Tax=Mycena citricolor TaxID=2018698 RepID=A0AAD2HV30_9AGAR|nr:unnamed protein product [Mycena citricolor]
MSSWVLSWAATALLLLSFLNELGFVAAYPGPCSVLSSDQLQSIPGWAALQSAVEEGYGTEPYKVVTNDYLYPDKPASMCGAVAQGWVWFEYHAKTQGHYKWSFEIEKVLPEIEDRTLPDVTRTSFPAKLRRGADFSDL